jgi:hypothetical protein
MCRKGKFNLSYKVLSAIAASSVLLLLPFNSFAQDLPCEDQNPFENCPLDNWVWVLVLAFIIFGVIKIKRRENTRIKPSV